MSTDERRTGGVWFFSLHDKTLRGGCCPRLFALPSPFLYFCCVSSFQRKGSMSGARRGGDQPQPSVVIDGGGPSSSRSTDTVALWLNSNPSKSKEMPSSGRVHAARSDDDANSVAGGGMGGRMSLFALLRVMLRDALLEESNDEEALQLLADEVHGSIVMSLSSSGMVYVPSLKYQRHVDGNGKQSAGHHQHVRLSSQAAQRASSIIAGIFHVPSETLWRNCELECVVCRERFMVPHSMSMVAHVAPDHLRKTQKMRKSAGESRDDYQRDPSAATASARERLRWCSELVDHVMTVHAKTRGRCEKLPQSQKRSRGHRCTHPDPIASGESADDDDLACTALRKPRGAASRTGQPPSLAAALSVSSDPSATTAVDLPLHSLHHHIQRAAATSRHSFNSSTGKSGAQRSSPVCHLQDRHMAAMTDLVFRESLLCPCPSAAWLREDTAE